MKKNNKRKKSQFFPWTIATLIILIIVIGIWMSCIPEDKKDDNSSSSVTVSMIEEPSSQLAQAEFEDIDPMELGNDLVIDRIGNYTGIYMEDGTNDVVSRVMMLILVNKSEKDLQYAEIYVEYTDFTATYKVTNLPVGESVVLLEQSRHKATSKKPLSAIAKNVVFFETNMALQEDVIQVSGMEGALNVKNISNSDITGDIYIYYKNSAQDLYYGGITYRAKVEGGLKAGEIKQVMTGHYSPKGCTILMVTGAK